MTRTLTNRLVHAAIERASEIRAQEQHLKELMQAPGSRFVPVWLGRNLVVQSGPVNAVRLRPGDVPWDDEEPVIFLGMMEGRAYFALDLAADDRRVPELEKLGRFQDLHSIGALLDDQDASILSYARGMCLWHRRHLFCGACGHPTTPGQGGHVRQCSNRQCGIQHFPRTDPAIIVLVHDGDQCLLGRKPQWPIGRYSTIAGFVEPGEAVELAVVREVREETGVRIGGVSYHSSQPWPFPGSVMLGFHAQAAGNGEIELLDGELEHARWFHRRDIEQAMNKTGSLRLPSRISIARRLIEDWYRNDHP